MSNNRVLLGMSGGVDSTVAAILLKEQGYEVLGATMLFCDNQNSKKSIEDAKKVCEKLEIKHITIDFKNEFKELVINKFICEYQKGITPNPCVECNKYFKFNYFYNKAVELNCNYIATGHYAKIEYDEMYKSYVLKKAETGKKEQSYVLYNIKKEILPNILFPLGNFSSKEEIRKIAKNYNLKEAEKPDSQEICFIPDNDYSNFLNNNLNTKPAKGDIIDREGKILGTHNGLINYTIGQRKGLGISNKTPLFVIKLDVDKNQLIVGEEKDIYSTKLIAKDINYLLDIDFSNSIKINAKIRYNAEESEAILYQLTRETARVEFLDKQRAITKGQSVVFYLDNILLGGGKIYDTEE